MAESYMRASGTAIREIPITQREPPERGSVSGQTVGKDEAHIAVATAANSFVVVEASSAGPREYKSANDCHYAFIKAALRLMTDGIEGDEAHANTHVG